MTGSSVGFNVSDLPLTTLTDFERPLIDLVFTAPFWTDTSTLVVRPVVVVIVRYVRPVFFAFAVTLNEPLLFTPEAKK